MADYTTPVAPAAVPGTDDSTPQARADAQAAYEPTAQDRKLVDEINRKFDERRRERQNHEPQWFINAAMFRGNHDVSWSSTDNRLIPIPSINPARTRRKVNRLFAKVRARRAKFLKNRPTWIVVSATTDMKDKLNARATGKVLDYIWRRIKLEQKYRDAVIWAEQCGRGYWWFNWNAEALGRVKQTDASTGESTISEAVVGEVTVECGSPFEVLPDNIGASNLNYCDELIRAKERTLDYIIQQYPERGHLVAAESSGDTFQYESQISTMNTSSGLFGSSSSDTSERRRDMEGNPSTAIVKEFFKRPTGGLPKGKYCVVANGVLLKELDELPFGFWDLENPFPCVEFIDVASPGQYWGTTVLEQLIDLQREYNGIRTMISQQLKLMGHPKIFVAKQHQIQEGAWTPDAGEIIEYNARPGIPPPEVIQQGNIASDAWRLVELIRSEFDDIPQIYPVSEGKTGTASSGFQTNLLQEATDTVHAPDVRGMELAIEEAAFKIRRIIKQGYDLPRLISVASGSYEPEVFEFSSQEVDEYADIIVQAGSALPMLKGARIQATLDLYAKGVLGDPMDPNVRRRVLSVLDLGGLEDIMDYNRVDEDMINIENSEAEDGVELAKPRFYENHQAHWTGHINRLKAPSVMAWPTEARMGLLAHAILHAMFINHAAAYQMSIEAGLQGLVPPPMLLPGPGGLPGGPAGGPGGPPGPPGGPPQPGSSPAGSGPPGASAGPSSGTPAGRPNPDHSFNEARPVGGGAPPPLAGGPNPNSNT